MVWKRNNRNLIYRITPNPQSGQPVYWWDIKGWLIFYNIALDQLIADVTSSVGAGNSIAFQVEQMPLEVCVLILEDRHYYKHNGIDYRFVPRIVRQLLTGKRVGGVSTIEQQYVRTFLNRKERTFGRKFNEWILAWLISHRSSKPDILRAYLSCAYYGYKLNGCDDASRRIFAKDASSLTLNEAALIASLLVYPLPAQISDYGEKQQWFPATNINQFFNQAEPITPRWANRIRRRWIYALKLINEAQ